MVGAPSPDTFEAWLAAREPTLSRTAALLADDPAAAAALLRPVLARVCADWGHTGVDGADDHALSLLVAAHRRTWPASGEGPLPTAPPPTRLPIGPPTGDGDPARAARALVSGLSPRARAVAVLRHHQLLDEHDTALLLGLPETTVRDDDQALVSALDGWLATWQRTRGGRVPDASVLLAGTLHAWGEEAAYAATDPAVVRAEARRIAGRRRRTTYLVAGGIGAAALAAGLFFVDPLPDPVATPAGDSTRTRSTPRPGPLQVIEAGEPPRVPYLVGDTYVDADGLSRELPDPTPAGAVPFGDLLWVTGLSYDSRAPNRLTRLDARGRASPERQIVWQPVVSRDRESLAWVEVRGRRAVLHRDGQTQDVGRWAFPVGFVGDDVVFVDRSDNQLVTKLTDLDSPPRPLEGVLVQAVDPVNGLVAGIDDEGRAVVLDPFAPPVRWRAAGLLPDRFSPDGRLLAVLGTPADPVEYEVVDAATGRRVLTVHDLGVGVTPLEVRWEDDDHLLVLATALGRTAILRVGLDGAVETATKPIPVNVAGGSEYRFAER